ncbi:MAG: tyrosine-type recombinase/integrase [Solirubrobacterales bacterium]|nr:tyrosine-type recombinase/integrase [Solirubrobacterales bacterium]
MSKPKMKKTSETGIFKREGKQGTRYYVVVDVGVKENGKRDQRWHSGFRTLRDARKSRAEIIGRLDRGNYVAPSKLTLRTFVEDEWLPSIETRLRPSTFTSYAGNLRKHVIPELGSYRLQQITPSMLNKLYADLGGSLSASTVRYVHSITRRALADAEKWDRLARNPADRATAPKLVKPKQLRTWTAVELRRYLAHVSDDRLYAAWRLSAMTGLRRGELLGLRWRDLDLDSSPPRMTVAETLIGARESSTPKTAEGRRNIDLDPGTVSILRVHRKSQAEERLALGPGYQDRDLVFCGEDGSPLWPRTFSRMFDRHSNAADLPRIPLKNLRHTHATLLLANGVPPKVIQNAWATRT